MSCGADLGVLPCGLLFPVPAGSIELKLHDMVWAAKSSEHCTIKMAKENATPRFSIFRNKRMRGWWPFIKPRDQEDDKREEREYKKKKKKKWSSSVKPEDMEFTDLSGNKYLLTVRWGSGTGEHSQCFASALIWQPVLHSATQLTQDPEDFFHLLPIQHFVYPEEAAAVACKGV